MKGTLNPIVKVCCIKSISEANLAIQYGANAIGLVSAMPSGPGVIEEELIKEISSSIEHDADTFLLTSKTIVSEIIEQYKRTPTTTIQIVDKLTDGIYLSFREEIPDVNIVQVIHVINEKCINHASKVSEYVDAILLDSGNPNATIKKLGGTGKTHNWEISKTIREELSIPVYLAGGLNSRNIREAIEVVQPYGVDLCSGVRTNGVLDEAKLKAFFMAIDDLTHDPHG